MKKITITRDISLAGEDAANLYKLMKNRKTWGKSHFKAGKEYKYNGTKFIFEQEAICEYQSDKSFKLHYIDTAPMGEGAFSTVHDIDRTLHVTKTNVSAVDHPPQIVKIQSLCSCQEGKTPCGQDHYSKSSLENEFNILSKIDYLGPQKPFFHKKNISYLIMPRIEGLSLNTIITNDLNKTNPLSVEQRLELHLGLLRALEKITNLNIIHTDIKPDNIVVNLGTTPITIYLIDFGNAFIIPDRDASIVSSLRSIGNFNYMSPEAGGVVNKINHRYTLSDKTDVFSMGRILATLWGGYQSKYFAMQRQDSFIKMTLNPQEYSLETLFETLPAIQSSHIEPLKAGLKAHLMSMLGRDPATRKSIKLLLQGFQPIWDSYFPKPEPQVVEQPPKYKYIPDPEILADLLNTDFPCQYGKWEVTPKKDIAYYTTCSSIFSAPTPENQAILDQIEAYIGKIKQKFPACSVKFEEHKECDAYIIEMSSFPYRPATYQALIKELAIEGTKKPAIELPATTPTKRRLGPSATGIETPRIRAVRSDERPVGSEAPIPSTLTQGSPLFFKPSKMSHNDLEEFADRSTPV